MWEDWRLANTGDIPKAPSHHFFQCEEKRMVPQRRITWIRQNIMEILQVRTDPPLRYEWLFDRWSHNFPQMILESS